MVKPGKPRAKDITEWEKVLKFPKKPENYDLEKMYEEGIKRGRIDRTQSAVTAGPGFMPWSAARHSCR